MRFFAERMKIVVEPTGCLAAAALLERAAGLPDLRGQRVGVILAGATSTYRASPNCWQLDARQAVRAGGDYDADHA